MNYIYITAPLDVTDEEALREALVKHPEVATTDEPENDRRAPYPTYRYASTNREALVRFLVEVYDYIDPDDTDVAIVRLRTVEPRWTVSVDITWSTEADAHEALKVLNRMYGTRLSNPRIAQTFT